MTGDLNKREYLEALARLADALVDDMLAANDDTWRRLDEIIAEGVWISEPPFGGADNERRTTDVA